MSDKTRSAGYASVAAAALLWAFSGNASKFLFMNGVSPFQLVQLRTTISSVLLLFTLLIFRRDLLRIRKRDIPYFIVLGAILAAVQFTYLYTISLIPVAAAILIQYQSPVLIALHARAFRKVHLKPAAYIAIAGAIAGCYLMVGAYDVAIFTLNRTGLAVGLISAAAFAWYAIKSEDGMKEHSPWTILAYALIFAAVIWNVLLEPLFSFRTGYDQLTWGIILFICIFGTILPFGLYNLGIRAVHATHASITSTLEPVFAGIVAYLILHESLGPLQITGAGLIMISILLLQFRKFSRE